MQQACQGEEQAGLGWPGRAGRGKHAALISELSRMRRSPGLELAQRSCGPGLADLRLLRGPSRRPGIKEARRLGSLPCWGACVVSYLCARMFVGKRASWERGTSFLVLEKTLRFGPLCGHQRGCRCASVSGAQQHRPEVQRLEELTTGPLLAEVVAALIQGEATAQGLHLPHLGSHCGEEARSALGDRN